MKIFTCEGKKMYTETNGLVHNAFYKKSDEHELKYLLWGRSQGSDTDIYDYHINDKGEIEITEKEYILK